MKDYIIVDSEMNHIPEYYPYMYLDGYTPTEILYAAHRKMKADYLNRHTARIENHNGGKVEMRIDHTDRGKKKKK